MILHEKTSDAVSKNTNNLIETTNDIVTKTSDAVSNTTNN